MFEGLTIDRAATDTQIAPQESQGLKEAPVKGTSPKPALKRGSKLE